jgi:hypothetical protein
MSVDGGIGAATGNPAGAVVGLVVQLGLRIARGNKPTVVKVDGVRQSKAQRRALGFTQQQSLVRNLVSIAQNVAAARRPGPQVGVQPPAATRPADPGYRPDLTERRLPPLNRAPPARGPTAADVPRASGPGGRPVPPLVSKAVQGFMRLWLGRAGIAVSATATVAYLIDLWFRTFPGQPLPDKPPPRAGTGSQGGKGTQRPQLPPEIIFSPTITVNVPRQPAPAPLPAPPVVATPMPAPVPRAPAPAPMPAPAPAPAPARGLPAWAQYAPALLPLLFRQEKRKKRKRATPGPAPLVPGLSPGLTPGIEPGLGLAPTLADYPLFSGGNYFDSTPSQNCDCAPKKKRAAKKKRTVCFTGRFTERANGLRKYEKRKIKCR